MSKGSVQRPDYGAYQNGWDRIFGKKEPIEIPAELRKVIDGAPQATHVPVAPDNKWNIESGWYKLDRAKNMMTKDRAI